MFWRTRRALCILVIFVLCAGATPSLAGDILPGLQAPEYPTATTTVATPTPVASAPPPSPMLPPGAQTSGGLTSVPAAGLPPAPAPQLGTPLLQETPQIISSAPPSSPSDGLSFLFGAPMRPRSDIYARVDYFTWREFIDSYQVLEESGPLVTIGYLREGIHSRIRAELFGGNVDYNGETMDGVELNSQTGYFGGRFELDLLARRPTPRGFVEFFAGLGTRAWQRDLKSGFDEADRPVISYQEDWWTVYFYGGLGISRALSPTLELYSTARVGATIFTRQQISLWDDYLQPKPGFTGAMEFGLRGKHVAMAVRMETMAWAESNTVASYADGDWWGVYQPRSEMSTVGLSLAYTY
jgi:hypothetical protein